MAVEATTGMSDMGMSLAEFARMGTDDIPILTSRLPAAGMYLVRGSEVAVAMTEPQEQGQLPLFRVMFKTEILDCTPVRKDIDANALVGRNLNENFTIWPSDRKELLGLLRGRYKVVELPHEGPFGGVEGEEPGWLDGMVNHIWRIRVRHYTSKGEERAAFDWLALDDETKKLIAQAVANQEAELASQTTIEHDSVTTVEEVIRSPQAADIPGINEGQAQAPVEAEAVPVDEPNAGVYDPTATGSGVQQ